MQQASPLKKPLPAGRSHAESSATALGQRLARTAGSLTLALILLPTLALALSLGILVESRHDQQTAHQLVYGSWWFLLLLGLLFVNILFAAVKKWPWKRHQIGFLITHLGLLTLIVGGAMTVLGGVSGRMILVDSSAVWAERFGPHSSDRFVDASLHRLQVRRVEPTGQWEWELDPGVLPWGVAASEAEADTLTAALHRLAQPFGGQESFDLGDGLRLEVVGYLPRAEQVPVRAAPPSESPAAPAVRFQIISSESGPLPPRWVAYHDGLRRMTIGPGLVEFLARECHPRQLAEFRNPPTGKTPRGVLVVGIGNEVVRIDEEHSTGFVAVGESGWQVRVLEYLPDYKQPTSHRPTDPAVSFELAGPDGKRFGFVTLARHAGDLYPLPGSVSDYATLPDFWVWYHAPDPAYGDEQLRGVLQWAGDSEGRLWLRSWSTRAGVSRGEMLGFEGVIGPLQAGEACRVWGGMRGRVRILSYLPRSIQERAFEPASDAARDAPPALRCRLRRGDDSVEFWVGHGEDPATVTLGRQSYQVLYGPVWRQLPFTLALLRAEQRTEENREGPQASWISLTDPAWGIAGRLYRVSLNEPLGHRGYRIYQGGYKPLGRDPDGKPLGQAALTVTRDPGLYFKYAGSFMVACGIFVMFWMRAYFFRHVPAWKGLGGESADRVTSL